MKILVVGAKGQLGREIRKQSHLSDHTFIFADIQGDGETVMRLDMTDPQQVLQFVADDTDVIINCAAYNDVEKAESDEQTAMKVNAYAVGLLADAAKNADALLIHFSTDYVFDGKANTPYTEDAVPNPLSAYGRSKLAGEKAVLESGCRYMIFRTSWLYSLSGRNFFKTIADKCAGSPTVNVVMDQTGTPTNAEDLAGFIMYVIENDMLDKTGLYHYSNDGVASWFDFAAAINQELGYTCSVKPCRTSEFPTKAVRPAYSVMDKRKVKETFGVEVPHWRGSLKIFVMGYLFSETI